MASTIPSFPGQQQPDPGAAVGFGQASSLPQAAASTSTSTSTAGAWQSSGSIGPFFGVISVLAVLAVISCFVGRIITRKNGEALKMAAPLDHINGGGWMWKVKRKLRWSCGDGNDRVIGRPVVDGEKEVASPA